YLLVMVGLFRIDFPVMVGIQGGEETRGIGLHFVERQIAVMILVSFGEPHGKRIAPTIRVERLAHGTDEDRAPMTGYWRRGGDGRCRLSADCSQDREKGINNHWGSFPGGGRPEPMRVSGSLSRRLGHLPFTGSAGLRASRSCRLSLPACFLSRS